MRGCTRRVDEDEDAGRDVVHVGGKRVRSRTSERAPSPSSMVAEIIGADEQPSLANPARLQQGCPSFVALPQS